MNDAQFNAATEFYGEPPRYEVTIFNQDGSLFRRDFCLDHQDTYASKAPAGGHVIVHHVGKATTRNG